MSKKKLLTVALAVAIAAIMACGTLAYFTADDSAKNELSIGNVAIDLTEPMWDSEGKAEAEDAYPGEALAKDPQVTNTGANPCFIRVQVTGMDCLIDAGLSEQEITTRYNDAEGYNTDDWELLNGYYYYKKVVDPGKTTSPIFDHIVVPADTTNGDGETLYSVNVQAFAVQAQGAKSSYAAVKTMTTAEIAAWFETCYEVTE